MIPVNLVLFLLYSSANVVLDKECLNQIKMKEDTTNENVITRHINWLITNSHLSQMALLF